VYVRKNCFREEFKGKKLSEMMEALYYRPSSDKKVTRKERDIFVRIKGLVERAGVALY
jgi:hypothetical protein